MRSPSGTPTIVAIGRLSAWLVTAWLASRATVDPDLWGHVRFGLDLLAMGRLTAVDPYSFTQDVPWINHEWLSELLFALAFREGGVVGLLLLKTVLLVSAAWFLSGVVRHAEERLRWWLAMPRACKVRLRCQRKKALFIPSRLPSKNHGMR